MMEDVMRDVHIHWLTLDDSKGKSKGKKPTHSNTREPVYKYADQFDTVPVGSIFCSVTLEELPDEKFRLSKKEAERISIEKIKYLASEPPKSEEKDAEKEKEEDDGAAEEEEDEKDAEDGDDDADEGGKKKKKKTKKSKKKDSKKKKKGKSKKEKKKEKKLRIEKGVDPDFKPGKKQKKAKSAKSLKTKSSKGIFFDI